MFDELREQLVEPEEPKAKKGKRKPQPKGRRRGIFGMTPAQTFFISLMVFLNVCVLGFFTLIAFGRIAVPGL
jgi:hypothetical protein